MHPPHRCAGRQRLGAGRVRERHAGEELDQAGGAAFELVDRAALAIGQRARDGQAAIGEMVEQREKIGQVVRRDSLLVERQEEAPLGGVDHVVAVLDALGDALERGRLAMIEARQEVGKRFRRDLRVDRHQAASSPRGSLNAIFSSTVSTSRSVTSKRAPM